MGFRAKKMHFFNFQLKKLKFFNKFSIFIEISFFCAQKRKKFDFSCLKISFFGFENQFFSGYLKKFHFFAKICHQKFIF